MAFNNRKNKHTTVTPLRCPLKRPRNTLSSASFVMNKNNKLLIRIRINDVKKIRFSENKASMDCYLAHVWNK